MNAREKYEIIMDSIEQMIIENELDDQGILDRAFKNADFPKNDREINIVFDFLLGKKGREYLSIRKLMAGYKIMLNSEDKDKAKEQAQCIFGRETNDSYFITRFGQLFGMSPVKAIEANDPSLYKARPTWESLSIEEGEKNMNMFELLLDLPEEYKMSIYKALNLKDFYDLNEEEGKFAYSLYKAGVDIDESFKYIADYVGTNDSEDRDDRLKTDLSQEDVKYLYFDCDFGFNDIFKILFMKHIKQFNREIKSCERRFLDGCVSYVDSMTSILDTPKEMDMSYQEKYDYYNASASDTYTDMDFSLYLFYLPYYGHKEAFAMIKPGQTNQDELIRVARIYGNTASIEKMDIYQEMRDDSYNLEEDYDRFETEGYSLDEYDDYVASDDEEMDDVEWMTEELLSDHPAEIEDVSETFEFNLEEFDRLCKEYDGDLKEENVIPVKKKLKKLTKHKDLNVEDFWNKISDKKNPWLLLDI